MRNAPCKVDGVECPDRTPTCRENCNKWADYRRDIDARAEAERKAKRCNNDWWSIRHHGKKQEKKGVNTHYVH